MYKQSKKHIIVDLTSFDKKDNKINILAYRQESNKKDMDYKFVFYIKHSIRFDTHEIETIHVNNISDGNRWIMSQLKTILKV